jgi:hypothetical protein
MKTRINLIVLILFISNMVIAQQKSEEFPKLIGPYLGQEPPGKIAEPFAEKIIAQENNFHGSVVFSPDGNEAFWSVMDKIRIMHSKKINGVWTKPELFMQSADVPFFSPDGKRLFFIEVKIEQGRKFEVPSAMDKTATGWTKAYPLPDIINKIPIIHWQVSVDKKGNFFFGGKMSGNLTSRIYCAEYVNGSYLEPKIIPSLKDYEAFSPFIDPDGNFLIVTAFREELGLYILFKKRDGSWTNGKNISEYIGTSGELLCPILTNDSKYLFFLKGVGDRTIPYWVDASFIEDLRKEALKDDN